MGTLYKKIILMILLFFSTTLFANVAKVVAFKGEATITREGRILLLNEKSIILKHDEIKTKENTKIQLLFQDETIVSIGKNSTFKVLDYLYDEKNNNYKVELNMIEGTFRTITGKIGKFAPKRFNLKTKSASIGIRGTQIVMSISNNEEKIFCTEGKIFVQKLDSKISSTVNAGEFVSFIPGENKQKIDVKKIKKDDLKNINKNVLIQKNFAVDTITLKSEIEDEDNNKQASNTFNATNTSIVTIQNNETTKNIDSEIKKNFIEDKKEIKEEKKKQEKEEISMEKQENQNKKDQDAFNKEKEKKAAASKAAAKEAKKLAEGKKAQAEANKTAAEEAAKLAEEKLAQAEADKANASNDDELAAAEEALKLAKEKLAQAEADKIAAEEAAKLAEEILTKLNTINLFRLTSKDFLKNNNSKVKYTGHFNNYAYNKDEQYLKKHLKPIKIPINTSISMDIDFGAKKNHISNGKVIVSNTYKGYYDTTLEFNGKIKNPKKAEFELKGINNTKGEGEGTFYGNKADTIKGELDLKNNDIQIEGNFDANKEGFDKEFFTIDDITPKSYFENFNSVATYKGNFNNYDYDKNDQYIQYTSGNKEAIPTDTNISMDVDFGATSNHISNGKIQSSRTSEILTFDGHYKDKDAKFNIHPTGNTKGSGGKGHFYGSQADIMSGKIDFNSKTTKLKIKGNFDAKKQ